MTPDPHHLALPAGALLFQEGDAGSAAYLVVSGSIDIFVTRGASDQSIARRGVGEIVGEMALLDSRPRSASARAVEPCVLAVITADQIERRLQQVDPILRMCLEVVIARFREMIGGTGAPKSAGPTPASRAALDALSLEGEIRRGLAESEFCLYYQPIVDLQSRALAGFEGLMRWRHPTRGLVAPVDFIPAAEVGGLICDLTALALAEAALTFPLLTAAAKLQLDAAPFLSINVSCQDLLHPDFARRVEALTGGLGEAAGRIKLELTESALMQDAERATIALENCRRLGVGVAIDDFGTGYSSLGYLATLPITTLKVDRSFVRSMRDSAANRKIVQTILRLAEELDIPVVAEGVETETEAEELAAMGCQYGQGYGFGRPVSLEETVRVIAAWPRVAVKRPHRPAAANAVN